MSENISPEVEALSGLHALLGKAIEALKQPQMQLHLVIIAESGPPEVKSVETEEECIKIIKELKEKQAKEPEGTIYIQLFEGKKWVLVKGINPGLKCGKRFIPFDASDGSGDSVDESGSLN